MISSTSWTFWQAWSQISHICNVTYSCLFLQLYWAFRGCTCTFLWPLCQQHELYVFDLFRLLCSCAIKRWGSLVCDVNAIAANDVTSSAGCTIQWASSESSSKRRTEERMERVRLWKRSGGQRRSWGVVSSSALWMLLLVNKSVAQIQTVYMRPLRPQHKLLCLYDSGCNDQSV